MQKCVHICCGYPHHLVSGLCVFLPFMFLLESGVRGGAVVDVCVCVCVCVCVRARARVCVCVCRGEGGWEINL